MARGRPRGASCSTAATDETVRLAPKPSQGALVPVTSTENRNLVVLQRSPATNSPGMFREPLPAKCLDQQPRLFSHEACAGVFRSEMIGPQVLQGGVPWPRIRRGRPRTHGRAGVERGRLEPHGPITPHIERPGLHPIHMGSNLLQFGGWQTLARGRPPGQNLR